MGIGEYWNVGIMENVYLLNRLRKAVAYYIGKEER